jgi:AraC family ethanolamine operon transcriptional activator
LESDLVHLAARLRSWGARRAKPESASRRRAAVRRVEEYLAAQPAAMPSLVDLCELAGVSERTLEYAFQEQLGMTPARYLRIRRLNAVRRELRDGDPDALRVTDVAMRWGFWELGRFASEYRAPFGERPSQTLATRAAARPRSPRA